MLPEAARTLALVLEVHSGDPWHGYSTRRILDGVTAAQAAARPASGAHSIWEIVLHMTGWTREISSRLRGGEPKDPEAGDWPEVGEPAGERWTAALAALDEAQRELGLAAWEVADTAWLTEPRAARDPSLGSGKTLLATLEGLALHHAYHAGQIALLRRAGAEGR